MAMTKPTQCLKKLAVHLHSGASRVRLLIETSTLNIRSLERERQDYLAEELAGFCRLLFLEANPISSFSFSNRLSGLYSAG
jgi:hypothetical protein